MNNEALQKLIQGYKDPKYLKDNFRVPFWMNFNADTGNFHGFKPDNPMFAIDDNEVASYYQAISERIQKSSKFYIDMTDLDNSLTAEERAGVIEDLEIFSPYEDVFIQLEMSDMVINLLVEDITGSYRGIEYKNKGKFYEGLNDATSIFTNRLFLYDKTKKFFTHDFIKWGRSFHDSNVFNKTTGKHFYQNQDTYWIMNSEAAVLDSNNIRSASVKSVWTFFADNGILDSMAFTVWHNLMRDTFFDLNICLSHPDITDSKNVYGAANIKEESKRNLSKKKMKNANFRKLPKYTHKTLKINMYGEPDGDGTTNGSGNGTSRRKHAVRKHRMKIGRGLNKGKKVWRCAHFRGDKDLGIVSKDYKITGAPNE